MKLKIGDIFYHKTLGEVMIFSFENEFSVKVIVLDSINYYLDEDKISIRLVKNFNAEKIENPNWNKWNNIIHNSINNGYKPELINRFKELEFITYKRSYEYEIKNNKNERRLEKNRNFLQKMVNIFELLT